MPIRLLIVDDHEVVRSGLVALLKGSDIEIVGEASNGSDALIALEQLNPEVVLMDIRMVEGDGLTALERMREISPRTPVVMLSTYDNPTYIARSLAMGARDYILKGASRDQIVSAIQRAVEGKGPDVNSVSIAVRNVMEKRPSAADTGVPLTKREIQVLRHLALGLSNREIGQSLEISVETVKEHVQNILRKLQVSDRTQAAVWALKHKFA